MSNLPNEVSEKLSRVEGVIFDLDGLLLDTEPFYTKVTQRIVARFGKEFTMELKSQMMGQSSLAAARILVKSLELPISAEQYLADREEELMRLFPLSEQKDGADWLLSTLWENDIPTALATSSTEAMCQAKLTKYAHWKEGFAVMITGDDEKIEKAKPAPDIFLLAAARLHITPAHLLVFEDSPAGVNAGIAAGMTVAAVPDPQLDPTLVSKAHLTLRSLREFPVHLLLHAAH